MSQVERFGVEAVWLDAKFEKGVQGYNQSMKRADQNTKKATASMSNSFDQNQKAIDEWLSSYTRASTKVQQQTRKLPDEARKAAGGFKLSFTEIKSAIDLVVGTLRTFGRIASAAFQMAQEGAQQLAQQRSFAIVSGGADQAAKNLQAMRDATRGTATDAELMAQALGILALGLAKNEEELFGVTRNVTTLAKTFKGFGAERALLSFQLLASDLERSRARLDDFGLTMQDVKPRLDELVASGMDLQEATRTALLEAMDRQMEKLGLTAMTTADSFGQATAAAGNLSNEFKQSLAPAGAILADAFTQALTDADDLTEVFNRIARGAIKAASAMDAFFSVMTEFDIDNVRELGQVIGLQIRGELDASSRFWEIYNEGVARGTQAMNEASSVAADLGKTTEETGSAADEASEAYLRFADTISQLQVRGLEQLLDRAIAAERTLEDAAIARARKIEDIERQTAARRAQIAEQGAARRAQIEQNFVQTIENIQAQVAEERRSRQVQLNRQLEEIERRFQERRRQINQQFAVSFQRAVRSRDALALVEAIRTRDRDLQEARNQRNQERNEAQQAFQQQEQEQQRSLQRQIEAARLARQQQLMDLAASLAQQEADLRESAERQLTDFDRSQERKRQDQELAAQRQLADQERQFRQQQTQAQEAYQQNEGLYRNHLERMLALTNTFIPAIFGGGGSLPPPTRGRPGGRLAEGGAFVVNQPTTFTAGEAGPEVVIAQPLSQIALPAQTSATVGGSFRHDVSGAISAEMAGFQGRLTAEINQAVLVAFREVLR